ncbi:Geranylgeranyl transferase type-1 subunit beta [Pseudocercospora fuligena]|uniref:Geranylgeranyl transferase type-1 subunit beta n=1 Tax=Pseudocercospora fuligena TaxID=685502 RepID=A0A8H6RR67_9PEZI|nr:Geranylgeranyl transferase type-1 subunit beta [Pseudocercospora fuligena]
MSDSVSAEPVLDKARQVKYWTRCLKTYLPHHYTGNESNRMYLGFFIISALDLLDSWTVVANEQERKDYINWIYHCQHPDGGFRMWPGTDFGELRNESNAKWDPANVPATYFALSALLASGDNLERVNRRKTLQWIQNMQREDGSFGETLVEDVVEGGMDPRFGYCATGIRYILRGDTEGPLKIDDVMVDDIDIDGLVRCITLAESYDGGIADQPFHEPHAGYEFCALGALNFVKRLQTPATASLDKTRHHGPTNPNMTIRWLVERQTDLEEPEEEVDIDAVATNDPEAEPTEVPKDTLHQESVAKDSVEPDPMAGELHQSPDKSIPITPFGPEPQEAGMNGRMNKVADTCYAWWAGASFYMMQQPQLFNHTALKRYLLGKTQHPALGGFGKFPGDLPDLYHSCLGLAALGMVGVEGIKEVDPAMCISKTASARIPELWQRWKD